MWFIGYQSYMAAANLKHRIDPVPANSAQNGGILPSKAPNIFVNLLRFVLSSSKGEHFNGESGNYIMNRQTLHPALLSSEVNVAENRIKNQEKRTCHG